MSSYDEMVSVSSRYLQGLIGHDTFHCEAAKLMQGNATHAEWTWLAVAIDQYAALLKKPIPFMGDRET